MRDAAADIADKMRVGAAHADLTCEQNGGELIVDEYGHDPLHEAGMADVAASFGVPQDIAPQAGDFKIRAGPVVRGLDRGAAGGTVFETFRLQERPQPGADIVDDDLEPCQFFKTLDGPFRCFEEIWLMHRMMIAE